MTSLQGRRSIILFECVELCESIYGIPMWVG